MREEDVTKSILNWLISRDWEIVCFDFPQSGTGRLLHKNGSTDKTKDAINPDIVAVKGKICLFFENKDRFYLLDFIKQNQLITNNNYTESINNLLSRHNVETIYYGIGIPSLKFNRTAKESSKLVDFIIGVNEDKSITVLSKNF